MTTQHFRFLDLPKELRLMCYERIPITTHHHFVRGTMLPSHELAFSNATIVTKSTSCSILTVCRLVHAEATTIFAPRLQHLRASPTRLIVELGASQFMPKIFKIVARINTKSLPSMTPRDEGFLTLLEQAHAIDIAAATTFIVKFAASMARNPVLVVAVTQGPEALPSQAATLFVRLRKYIRGFCHVHNRRLNVVQRMPGWASVFSIIFPGSIDLGLEEGTNLHAFVQRESARLPYYERAEEVEEEEWKREWEVGGWFIE